ncbi:unnamed protein product [Thlaspi arvense]|uniref:Serine-threonine/tyrosine-protein kinase catalytic domain-containing protein n=1 Tax=Thlaspi arvense TaxID=13288 RepID=A0AAU9S2E0_THLAR|nr:unnamed protein product [Thlaspi arvense]
MGQTGHDPRSGHSGLSCTELTRTGKATTSTDVFAFGSFLLEVACGRRPIELRGTPESILLVDWVFEKWKTGVLLEASDPNLGEGVRSGKWVWY